MLSGEQALGELERRLDELGRRRQLPADAVGHGRDRLLDGRRPHPYCLDNGLLALLNRLERRVLRGAPEVVAGSGSHESSWFAFVCLV